MFVKYQLLNFFIFYAKVYLRIKPVWNFNPAKLGNCYLHLNIVVKSVCSPIDQREEHCYGSRADSDRTLDVPMTQIPAFVYSYFLS